MKFIDYLNEQKEKETKTDLVEHNEDNKEEESEVEE